MKEKEVIVDMLLSQPRSHYNLDRTKIMMRCPWCGDSRSNPNETNFNVRIPDDQVSQWLYICFRASCGKSGIINQDFLRMLGHDNYQANVYLARINKESRKNKKFNIKGKRAISNFPNSNDKLNMLKLKYVNDRLGLELTNIDLMKLKINTNLEELYKLNYLKIPERKSFYYSQLSSHTVGFISSYNDYLICRNVSNNEKIKRYTILDIFEDDKSEEKFKFYVIPTHIDILSQEPIVINICEGTFDILSIYYNTDIGKDYDNTVYVAVCGSSYHSTITHLIRQYGLTDIIINIFSDSNIKPSEYENIHNSVKIYCNTIRTNVFYNDFHGEKDFGISKDNIIVKKYASYK